MRAVLPPADLLAFRDRDVTMDKAIALPTSLSYSSTGGVYGCYILGCQLGDGELIILARVTYRMSDVVLVASIRFKAWALQM